MSLTFGLRAARCKVSTDYLRDLWKSKYSYLQSQYFGVRETVVQLNVKLGNLRFGVLQYKYS